MFILTFLFFSKVLRALTPSGHNDPVCWDVDNCDKKTYITWNRVGKHNEWWL